YIVVGDCYVQLSESLTIEPGTTLFFSDYFTLYVYGQLLAEGTVQDSIRFTRYYPTEDCYHGGIRFMPGDSVQNRISYCHIEYANNEDHPVLFGGALFCQGRELWITNCSFFKNRAFFAGGIYIIESQVELLNSIIMECTGVSRGGGMFSHSSELEIANCEFNGNTSERAGGLYVYTNGETEIHHSTFASNFGISTAG
ncbi:MAG: right-handed parallel beta-helix repeat-containing protein, partial [bacterium]